MLNIQKWSCFNSRSFINSCGAF